MTGPGYFLKSRSKSHAAQLELAGELAGVEGLLGADAGPPGFPPMVALGAPAGEPARRVGVALSGCMVTQTAPVSMISDSGGASISVPLSSSRPDTGAL